MTTKISNPQINEIKAIKVITFAFEYPKTFKCYKNHIAEQNIINGIKFTKIKFGI